MKPITFLTTVSLALSSISSLPNTGRAASAAEIDQNAKAALNTLYVFFFSQKGLMGGIGLQGTKITQYTPSA